MFVKGKGVLFREEMELMHQYREDLCLQTATKISYEYCFNTVDLHFLWYLMRWKSQDDKRFNLISQVLTSYKVSKRWFLLKYYCLKPPKPLRLGRWRMPVNGRLSLHPRSPSLQLPMLHLFWRFVYYCQDKISRRKFLFCQKPFLTLIKM